MSTRSVETKRSIKRMPTYNKDEAVRYDQIIDQPVYKYYVDKKLKLINNWFKAKSVLLDVGCGTGVYTTPLATRCEAIVGLDISPEMVKRGASKAKLLCLDNIHFVVGDISYFPFQNNAFDLVFSVNLFHHVVDEKIIVGGLLEKLRCGRQGGYIVVFELNPNSLGWSENLIPKILRGFVYLLLLPFHQHVKDHIEEGTKIPNVSELFMGIKEIKVVLRKVGGFIPPYCPKFLFKIFVLLENIMETTPLLRRYGAHVFLVGELV